MEYWSVVKKISILYPLLQPSSAPILRISEYDVSHVKKILPLVKTIKSLENDCRTTSSLFPGIIAKFLLKTLDTPYIVSKYEYMF